MDGKAFEKATAISKDVGLSRVPVALVFSHEITWEKAISSEVNII